MIYNKIIIKIKIIYTYIYFKAKKKKNKIYAYSSLNLETEKSINNNKIMKKCFDSMSPSFPIVTISGIVIGTIVPIISIMI